ncbi:MAG: putative zinc-binding protein [Thermoleophilia bacterium]|nr:putative zinc-binding protein [Thermoleophilia bacterium]
MSRAPELAVVYACSGSSNVAQLANAIAVRLDRAGLADMSCIAGVGGDVKPLVRRATTSPRVVALDGCPLACCERVLASKGVAPERIVRLHQRGLRKRQHADFAAAETERVYRDVLAEVAPTLLAAAPGLEPLLARELSER